MEAKNTVTANVASTVVEIQVLEPEAPTPTGEPLGDPGDGWGALSAAGAVPSLRQACWGQRQARVLPLAPRPPRAPHIPRSWRNSEQSHHCGSPQAPGALSGALHDQLWVGHKPAPSLRHNSEVPCLIYAWEAPQCGNRHLPPASLTQRGLNTDAAARNLSADVPWAQRGPPALR